MFSALKRFLNSMDAKAWVSVGVTLALFAFVALMFAFGQAWLGFEGGEETGGRLNRLEEILAPFVDSPNAIFIVIAFFSILALTGFPQFLLFGATIAVFGPVKGAIYSWVATMCSASLTFAMGWLFGGGFVKRLSGERVQAFMRFVSERGVLASGLVRIVPSAPFIVVNAAAGSMHIPIWKFWLGTAMGIAPKIIVIAFFLKATQQIGDFFLSRDLNDLVLAGVVIVAWIGLLLLVRQLYLHFRDRYRSQLDER